MKIELLESFDRYLTLPRDIAYGEFMDSKNMKILRAMIIIFAVISAIVTIVNIATVGTFNLSLALSLIDFVLMIFLLAIYGKIFNSGNIRRSVIVFILLQMLLLCAADLSFPEDINSGDESSEIQQGDTATSPEEDKSDRKKKVKAFKDDGDFNVSVGGGDHESYDEYILFLAILLMIFRISRTQMMQIFGTGLVVFSALTIFINTSMEWDEFLPNFFIALFLFVVALSTERSRQKKFYDHYDFEHRKNFDSIRMKRELNYAREVQLSMLPKNEAVINGIKIAGVSIPASEVGGDYFDYFRISDHETGIFVCDVSGHGVASALMLSALRSSMHLVLDDTKDPKIIIEKLNRMIRKTQNRKMFVTAVISIIDTSVNKCRLYNAGHLPPYRISGETGEIFRIRKHGIALGTLPEMPPDETGNVVTFDFRKGDKIILYSDGVNEAMNSAKDEYGLDNFEIYLNSNSTLTSKELLDGIVADVKRFSGGAEQRDDLTLLIAERL